jgi:hypothetical protein
MFKGNGKLVPAFFFTALLAALVEESCGAPLIITSIPVPESAPIALLGVSAILLVAVRLRMLRKRVYAVCATKPLRQKH